MYIHVSKAGKTCRKITIHVDGMFFGRVKQLVDANVGKQAPQSRDRVYMEVLQHWCIARDAAKQLQGRTSLLMVSSVFIVCSRAALHVTYDVIKHTTCIQ